MMTSSISSQLCLKCGLQSKPNYSFRARKKLPLAERSDNLSNSGRSKGSKRVKVIPVETDQNKLEKRQKQLDIGKNTPGYERYVKSVPRYG